jgi:threonine aldolase
VLLRDELVKAGFKLQVDSPSNIQFVLLPNKMIEELSKDYGLFPTSKPDSEHTYIRLVTSWATKEKDVRKFLDDVIMRK